MERKLKDLKRGELFTRKPHDEPNELQVYIRGEYDRSLKRYEVTKWADMNRVIMLKGETTVYTGFTF